MSLRFFDTSALGRAFFEDEADHRELRSSLLETSTPTAISTLVRLEFVATCAALSRAKRINNPRRYVRRLDALIAGRILTVVVFDAQTAIPVAEDVLERRDLRTLDALHVATALLTARDLGDDSFVFVTRDAAQAAAARAEGLAVA